MHQFAEATQQTQEKSNTDVTSARTRTAGGAILHVPSSTSSVERPFDRGYNKRLLDSVGLDILNPTILVPRGDSATTRNKRDSRTTQTASKSDHSEDHPWTAWTTQSSVWSSPSTHSGQRPSPLDSLQPVDPAVIDYLRSLGLSPDKYASKLRSVGLDSGILLDAMKRMVPDNRKDKLEEDLQRLTGLTVAEAMVLVSGLRTGTVA